MSKSLIFPGQGAQFPGMGKALYESNSKAAALMEKANEILGFRITDRMFGDSAEALLATEVTQPAIFIHSTALALCREGIGKPDMTGGHSLGEFSALVAAGAVTFEDGLRLVAKRAEAMQKCCVAHPGKMAAVIGLPAEKVEEICRDHGVVAANYNSDVQTVISGPSDAIENACKAMTAAGARRALVLQVSGAFHSPLMEPARAELAEAIRQTAITRPCCPVYQNVSARGETDPQTIKDNLLRQLTSPVRWTQSVRQMLADGATEFTELGPGTVLQGLVAKIAAGREGITINGIQ